MKLKNNSDTSTSFKVKTTAPRNYFVKPNTGVLAPGEPIEI